jgi:hypothetical protein
VWITRNTNALKKRTVENNNSIVAAGSGDNSKKLVDIKIVKKQPNNKNKAAATTTTTTSATAAVPTQWFTPTHVHTYLVYVVVASLGMKSADNVRRVALFMRAGHHNKFMFALLRYVL